MTIKIRITQNVNTIILPSIGQEMQTQRTQLLDTGERLGPDYEVRLHDEPFLRLPRSDQEAVANMAGGRVTTLEAARQAVGCGRAEVIAGELPAFPYVKAEKPVKQEETAKAETKPAAKRRTRKPKK